MVRTYFHAGRAGTDVRSAQRTFSVLKWIGRACGGLSPPRVRDARAKSIATTAVPAADLRELARRRQETAALSSRCCEAQPIQASSRFHLCIWPQAAQMNGMATGGRL